MKSHPSTKVRAKEVGIELALALCSSVSILTTGGIIAVLLLESFRFFEEVSLSQLLFDTQWTPLFLDKHFGIWPLIAGTLLTSAIALSLSVPAGLIIAIYVSEFATERTRRFLKPILELRRSSTATSPFFSSHPRYNSYSRVSAPLTRSAPELPWEL